MPLLDSLKWLFVIIAAALSGLRPALFWPSSGSYISEVSDPENKNSLFALFEGLNKIGSVIGNIIIIFVLGKIGNVKYLIVAITLSIIGSAMFLLVPNASLDKNF